MQHFRYGRLIYLRAACCWFGGLLPPGCVECQELPVRCNPCGGAALLCSATRLSASLLLQSTLAITRCFYHELFSEAGQPQLAACCCCSQDQASRAAVAHLELPASTV